MHKEVQRPFQTKVPRLVSCFWQRMTGDTGGWYRSRALPQRAVPASSNVQLGHFTAIICSSRKGWCYPFQCLPKTHLIQSIAYSKAFVRHLRNVRFSEFEWAKLLYNFSFNRIEILVLIQSTTATITYPSAALGRIWLTTPVPPIIINLRNCDNGICFSFSYTGKLVNML